MNHWSSTTLGDIASEGFQNGIYKHSSLYGQGTPIVRINDFDNDGKFANENLQRVSISSEEMQRYRLQANDILINRVNSLSHIGKSVFVKNFHEVTVYESNMMRLRLEDSSVQPAFIAYLLQSSSTRNYFRTVAKKAVAQASINQDDLKQLEISLPPLAEQSKIVEILSTWDEAIDLTEQLIAAKQKRKQALMQRLLTGKVRFPKHKNQLWQEARLEDIASINPRRSSQTSEEMLVSFLGMSDVSEEGKIINRVERPLNEVKKGFTAFQNDDVLVAKITPCFENGKGALAQNLKNGIGFGSTEFHVVCADQSQVDPRFIYYHTITRNFRARGQSYMTGSAGQKRIPTDFIASYPIGLPSLEEQQMISNFLATCDEELSLLQQKLDALRLQKKGLMQQLLTGKIRVKPTPPQPCPNEGGGSDGAS